MKNVAVRSDVDGVKEGSKGAEFRPREARRGDDTARLREDDLVVLRLDSET